MADNKNKQSSLKKLLFVAVPLIGIIFLIPTGPPEKKGPSKTQQLLANAANTARSGKKVDPLHLKEDDEAQFEVIDASVKNSFVPLVTKKDANGPVAPNGIPASFADGEATWTYTGNMTVNGTPNALLENSATGEGVFLRPGQSWKKLRLLSVKEDSISIEGPAGATKTIYFNNVVANAPESLTPLPPVFQGGNGAASPANNGNGGGFGRPQRGNRPLADNSGGLSGPIGQTNAFEPSVDQPDPTQFNNRRRNRRNNENSLN